MTLCKFIYIFVFNVDAIKTTPFRIQFNVIRGNLRGMNLKRILKMSCGLNGKHFFIDFVLQYDEEDSIIYYLQIYLVFSSNQSKLKLWVNSGERERRSVGRANTRASCHIPAPTMRTGERDIKTIRGAAAA